MTDRIPVFSVTGAVQPVATCRQSPYLHKPAVIIMTSFHYDVIRASRSYGARSPRSRYDVILIMTSFATELATPSVTDRRTLRTDTIARLIYKDF